MTTWTPEDLHTIGTAEELEIASLRADRSLAPFTVIWVVRVDDELYVRAGYGRGSAWFRRVLVRHEGRIRAGGLERDASFEEPDAAVAPAIDAAYLKKYRRYGDSSLLPMTSAEAAAATLRLRPRP